MFYFSSCQDQTFLEASTSGGSRIEGKDCDGLKNGESEKVLVFDKNRPDSYESCEPYEIEVIKRCIDGEIYHQISEETIELSEFDDSCEVLSPEDCGEITHGEVESRVRFQSPIVGESEECRKEEQTRKCDNGKLSDFSGAFEYETCNKEEEPKDCNALAHGEAESRVRYESSSVLYGKECRKEEQSRKCENGELSDFSGSFIYEKCIVANPENCGEVAHSELESRVRFQSESVSYGEECKKEEQVRKCDNGKLSEFSGDFKYEKCEVKKPENCGEVAHSELQNRIRYYSESVAYGEECKKEEQVRKCDNGKLSEFSGDFQFEKCEILKPNDCGDVSHGDYATRIRFQEEHPLECLSEEQIAKCDNGQLGEFSGNYGYENCKAKVDPPVCKEGKVLVVSIDKDGDGVADTEPVEVLSYKGEYSASENYNYYSVSAHPRIGPQPEGYAANVYFYEGSDGLTLQFYYNKDKIKGDSLYDGSPNSRVKWKFNTEGNDLQDRVILSDDGREFKKVYADSHSQDYVGQFHYWNNTDGGVLGPFLTQDFRITVEPIYGQELKGTSIIGDAFNKAHFHSADGKKYDLQYENGVHSFIIEYKEKRVCEDPTEKIGCSDSSREGFKNLEDFPYIAGCAGGFTERGIMPEHRERKCDHSGNDSSNVSGENCGVQDLCAEGWEVVPSLSVLQEVTNGEFCHGMEKDELTENIAFVTGLTGPGWGKVYNDTEQLYAILNQVDYEPRGYFKHLNDVFYCGGQKVAHATGNYSYKPYFSSFSHNNCNGSSLFSDCQSLGGHLEANEYRQQLFKSKDSLKGGGVVCVKSSEVDNLGIDLKLRKKVEEEVQCENLIKNGSFEEGHDLSGNSWNTFGEVGAWFSDLSESHAGIEIQCGDVGPGSSEGKCHLELDAHSGKNGFKESDVHLFQQIKLEKGKDYYLNFDAVARSSNLLSNRFYIVLKDSEGKDHYIAKYALANLDWEKKSFVFISPVDGEVSLGFLSLADEDTVGANIDDIELYSSKNCHELED